MSQLKHTLATVKETVKEKLSFRELIELVKGSQDVEKRASVILNPKNPSTSTNLSASQIEFVAIAKTLVTDFPEFQGLAEYADEFLLASISKEGWGVDRMIQHEQAISEKRMMQLGLKPQEQKGSENVKQK